MVLQNSNNANEGLVDIYRHTEEAIEIDSNKVKLIYFLKYLYILDVTELKLSSKLVVKRVSNCWFENKYSVKL